MMPDALDEAWATEIAAYTVMRAAQARHQLDPSLATQEFQREAANLYWMARRAYDALAFIPEGVSIQ